MSIKKIFCTALLLLAVAQFNLKAADEPVYTKYKWEAEPKIHAISPEEESLNYVVLKHKVLIEFAYESSGQLVMYETIHMIIHFNNENGIEEMNKVYIPSSKILEEMDLKARTITHDGKVIMLSKDAVKKVDNLDDSGPYIIFAMEGVDKGGEIEYLYTNKKSSSLFSFWRLQRKELRKNVEIDIYSPENLIFEAKGHNGFPQFTKDTAITEKNHIYASIDKIEPLYEEKYSAYDANKMAFEYQLVYNIAKNKSRLYSWDYTAAQFYAILFNFTKADTKAMEKLISKLGLKKLKDDSEKLEALERYIKYNISIKETGEATSVERILSVKYGDELHMQKIYIGVAQLLGIPVEMVLTSDRFNKKFDSEFQSWNSLEDYLLYFPSIDKYLSAENFLSRLGYPPTDNLGNKGLFIKESSIGDLKTGIGKIKTLGVNPYDVSYNNITAVVKFDDTFTPLIDFKHEFMGYSAYYLQPTISLIDEAQKKEFVTEQAKFIGSEVVVKKSEISNYAVEDVYKKPFIVDCTIEAPHLIENAGNKKLFKVGALIGPQEELYQEKARQTDAEIRYAHHFTRILEITIPEGYKIANPEALIIDKKYEENGEVLCSFVSSYKLEGNVLKVKVYEDYRVLLYPKSKFEDYKAVINAAADFNKIVLILEK